MARKMKDSGIEWIGEIPEEWKMRKIKYILQERNEKNNPIKSTEILSLTANQGVIPYSEKEGGGNKPKKDLTAYKLAYPNDIVMNSMNVLSGSVDLSKYFGCVSPVYYMLYSRNNNINIKFYNYIFKTKEFQRSLIGLGNGILIKESDNGNLNTIRMRIPLEKLNGLFLMVPSSEEQEKIVEYLDSKIPEIDYVIAKTKETIEEYKKYKQAIITEAVTRGLNPDVEMKDSVIEWIGEIPDHWTERKIKYTCFTRNEKYTLKYGNLDYFGLENIESKSGNFIETDSQYDLNQSQICYEGDLVFGKLRPYLAKVYFVDKDRCCSGEFAVFYNFQGDIKYLKYLFLSYYFIEAIDASTYGTKMPRANIEFINNLFMPLPPQKEQQEIVDYLDEKCVEIDKLIKSKELIIEDLEAYKRSLIYEYVTGKKEVPESKIIPFPAAVNCKDKRFAQAVLLTKILDEFGEYHSGRVKVAKTLYVIENHIGFDFDTDIIRKVAGPLDEKFYKAEAVVRHNKWFNVLEQNRITRYFAGKDKQKYLEYYNRYFKDYDAEIQRIINIFKGLNMNEAELLATAYASWNDAIIKGNDFSKDELVDDIFSWDDSKKRFSKEKWLQTFEELKQKNIVPVGHGKMTIIEKE